MQMYSTNYASVGGFYVDATRNRYSNTTYTPAWRGGTSLASGAGTLFNSLFFTNYSYNGCAQQNYYNQHFYLSSSGDLQDIFERSAITNGGYLCKKFQYAPTPATVGYNLATCFPYVGSGGSCPSGWLQFAPNATSFCYLNITGNFKAQEEYMRQCYMSGADLVYAGSSSEFGWLYSSGLINSTNEHFYNAHRFRYGPSYSWSNGAPLNPSSFTNGINNYWFPGEPIDGCSMYSCANVLANAGGFSNDICETMTTLGSTVTAAVCKRPLCG